jgi:PIN domain nuclease of toxin-antitoxin system
LNLLLDTHTALWAITDDPRLPDWVRRDVSDPRNTVVVSAVSIWEIAIKSSLSRRRVGAMPIGGGEATTFFRRAGYRLLAISPEHAAAVERLPTLHADPFDRLLIAQALEEPLRLVTHDPAVAAYSDSIIRF